MSEDNPKEKKPRRPRNPFTTPRKHQIEVSKFVNGAEKRVKVWVWDVRKRYTKPNGEPGTKFKRCSTASEATTALMNFQTDITNEIAEAEIKAAEAQKPVKHTFHELCDYYEQKYVTEAVIIEETQIVGYRSKLSTIKGYIQKFKDFFGDILLENFNYELINDFSLHLATTPIVYKYVSKMPKRATVNRKLEFLRRIFTIGVQNQWLPINPFKLGKALINSKSEIERDRILTFDEEMRLLAACEGSDFYEYKKKGSDKVIKVTLENNPRPHLKLIIVFAIETGMRRREMFTTKFNQIDMNQKVIYLNALQTKALKSRFIPISERMEEELKKLFADNDFTDDDLIFEGIKNIKRSFATACRRANIENLRFHDLRHTATTWMAEAGVSQNVRMNIVGHSSERVHQRYNNVNTDVLENARGQMNEFRQKLEQKRKEEEEKKNAAA